MFSLSRLFYFAVILTLSFRAWPLCWLTKNFFVFIFRSTLIYWHIYNLSSTHIFDGRVWFFDAPIPRSSPMSPHPHTIPKNLKFVHLNQHPSELGLYVSCQFEWAFQSRYKPAAVIAHLDKRVDSQSIFFSVPTEKLSSRRFKGIAISWYSSSSPALVGTEWCSCQ